MSGYQQQENGLQQAPYGSVRPTSGKLGMPGRGGLQLRPGFPSGSAPGGAPSRPVGGLQAPQSGTNPPGAFPGGPRAPLQRPQVPPIRGPPGSAPPGGQPQRSLSGSLGPGLQNPRPMGGAPPSVPQMSRPASASGGLVQGGPGGPPGNAPRQPGGPGIRPVPFGGPRPQPSQIPSAQIGGNQQNGLPAPAAAPSFPGAQRPYYQGPTAPVGARAVGPPSLAGNPPRGPPGGPPSSYPSGASSARPAFAAFPPSFGSAAVPSPGPPSFQGGGAPPGPPAFGVPSNSNAMQGMQTVGPPGFRAPASQSKQLDQYESVTISPSGPGQPGLSPAQLPRPLGDEIENQIEAPPLAHPANCSAKYMRVTVSAIPSQQGMRARYQLPIGCIVHPLADPQDVPVVVPETQGIMRCRRCRTYINPFVSFQEGGRRFQCNVCGMLNEVPVEYYSPLDSEGVRQDIASRPELAGGSVDYIAPKEYMVRPPMPPVYFFVIDVSVTAVNSGMVATAAAAIRSCLDSLPGAERTRIGFLTFDQHLHFWSLKASLTQPQMMVVSEIDEPFVPQPDDLLVNLQESRGVIETFLDSLSSVFATNLSADSALGPALQAAFLIVNRLGGKMLVFQAAVPSLGIGKIKARDNHNVWNTDQEFKLRIPEDAFWKKFAAECSRVQIAVDVFSFCREYTDLASIASLPKFTCGQLYYYPSFNREKDGVKLTHEVVHNLTRTTGWEAVMRIRCSKGLRVSGFHGHFFIRSTDLLALPQVDPDKAFAVQIAHDENVVTSNVSYIQCALLYTSSSGERRIRVHTLMLPVVTDVSRLYETADGGAMATLIAKLAIEKSYSSKLEETRNAIQNKLVVALREYRILHSQQASQSRTQLPHNQLIYPSTLKYLTLWILGLTKSAAIRGSARDVVTDERIAVGLDLMSASVPTMLRLLYPNLYVVHDPSGDWGKPQKGSNKVLLPSLVPLSTEVLYPQGAYLMDNGRIFVLWLGREVSPQFLQEVFGIDPKTGKPTDAAGSSLSVEPARQSGLSQRLNAVLASLRSGRPNYQKCFSVRQGSPPEHHVLPYFVEDRSAGQYSYMDFVAHVHKQVLSK